MTSNRLSADELEVRVQELTAELEKANQALHAEILERKFAEEALCQSEQRIRLKPESLLSPAREVANLELAEIVDIQAIKSLMDDFYKLTHIPMSLNDLKGNVLAGTGWQDICTRFHRVHPVAFKHCVESNIELSVGVVPGEFKLFKCKNNMWDIATPIMIGDKQVGILFAGQFFFEDEPLDYELFRSQARQYGFNEEEYIAALEKVPRLSREAVDTGMAFLTKLAHMISQLSYSNIKLTRSLAERDSLVDALRESEERYRMLFDHSTDAFILSDPKDGGRILSANPAACRMLGWTEEELIGRGRDVMFDPEDPAVSGVLDELTCTGSTKARLTYTRKDGTTFPGEISSTFFTDNNGEPRVVIIIRDITERKRAEETLAFERSQLLSIFDGIDDVVYVTDPYTYEVLYANKAMKEKFGGELVGGICYREFQRRDTPCDFCTNPIILMERDKPYHWEYYNPTVDRYFLIIDRIIKWPDGRDVRFEIAKDITERKQEENRIRRYNRVLEGINCIFSKVVQAKTEEELGTACLTVALKVTGSQFGFINEMGADGLLHDVAKSELGWERCLMDDKTGHRRSPSDFVVHGLYGNVIINEKSFFTNDPQSHPDSIGVPPGHPPLTSFLGVPLFQNGKTVGLIAVANRENGYSCEQQEDLEAIAPAVTQALQRKKAEEALRLSNIYNRSLIEVSLDPLVTIGPDGKIMDVNGATEQVTGYSRNDLIGTDFSDYFTEREKARAGYQQVFTDGKVWEYPLEILHKDGHLTPVLYNASVYRDENGEDIGVFAAARDITERKKAEGALKKAHDNLEKLVEERTAELEKAYNRLKESEKGLAEAQRMAHIGNWSWNIATNELFWSDEVYRIFGLNPQEFKVTYDLFLRYVHPDDLDHLINAINEGLKGRPHDVDYRIILADGEERIVHTESEIIFYEGNVPVQAKGIIQDITERKKAEEKIKILANALESSNDAIVTESLEGIITSWNRGAEQIYGYSAEEILGKDISILEPANLKGEIKQLIERIKRGERVKHYETFRIKKDGTLINASVTLSPIFDASGELVAISAIARDITERIKAETALAEIDKVRIKEIHHRIKNNLQVISSLLDLQAEKFRDKEVLEAFRESQSRILSMSLIHEELYKGGGTDTVDFSAYLKKLAENLFQTYSLRSKNIRLYMYLEENAFFNTDTAVPLGIIVNELVSNSLKHAFTEKEGDIRIRLCREEMNHEISKSLYSLTISDNGKGIPKNVELGSVESLGLQLVNILVDQLDGNIELKRDHGTEFRITFNVAERP